MLSYFKANDPYRLLGAFILLLIIRVPILVSGVPLIGPELKWLLIGDRLGDGGLVMYKDLWDYTGPLAATVYKSVDFVFGPSRLVHQLLSTLLVIFQAAIFNRLMIKNKAYPSPSYVPALVYVIGMNMSYDFLTLSPVLMSMTFVLLALNNLFKRMDNQTQDELFVFTGIFLGIAVMFFLPMIMYVVVTFLALILYTGSIFRRIMLMIYGLLLVFFLSGLYYFWHDGFLVYNHHFFKSLWVVDATWWMDGQGLGLALLLPFAILFFSIYRTYTQGKYINFQSKIQSVMLMFLLSGFLAFFLMKEKVVYQMIYLVPVFAFFVSHHLLVVKNWILAEATTALVLMLVLMNLLFPFNNWLYINELVRQDQLVVKESPYSALVNDKRVLVIGDDLDHYQGASLATPYLDWQLSSLLLDHLNYFDNNEQVYLNFKKDMPEVIIDQKEVVPTLFERMPTIGAHYRAHPSFKGVYLRRE
ncbi:hypothetical protein [Reichenbachiella ulvae]|uniref:Dolichyl-phosphate-mannose-protein mannosyltransferase n=1 Tax=Reichenbachiella ulvae TaxID=2980104 RepID=A0ABT3D085_9BACT|nr:hypothetical protein [Reichenbachiella ulvae]MCV9389229.1 hypothetical protein [Reichenbachiella ulvae]